MAASDNSTSSLDLALALERLAISSPAENLLQVSADPVELRTFTYEYCSSSSGEDEEDADRKSPFHVFYLREDDDVSTRSKEETLLWEAWERKKKCMLQKELSNLEDRAQPGLLGRSSSCVEPMINTSNLISNSKQLDRSASDCGTPSKSVWGTHTQRLITDHDFEELQGFLDLGFQFDESSIPELCHTLPALEVYCAMAKNSLEGSPFSKPQISSAIGSPSQFPTKNNNNVETEQQHGDAMAKNSNLHGSPFSMSQISSVTGSLAQSPAPNSWMTTASPGNCVGDDPTEIKERLRDLPQALASTTRLAIN
ncbi:hypothetical protein GOP47_0005697 [Adiantum capillus-veneris]|uniref:Uncharacterized protein n=1 Tax=Adiantum capillus-veneris TaxID=13818 RepID=A0A9D4V5V0_ADICA|nr:hypothetical protein GOP47_0005697 [Adiantum capillus-veneris]